MAQLIISNELISRLLALPGRQVWTDYDSETDVLYISFRKPQQGNDSILEDDGNIYHYRDDELVGVTALNASRKAVSTGAPRRNRGHWTTICCCPTRSR